MSAILSAVEGIAIVRGDDGRFRVMGEPPAWCRALPRDVLRGSSRFRAEDAFPFLSAFLPEAEEAWSSNPPTRADSDLWTEVDANGKELHLEATAVKIDGARVLVIMKSDRLFKQTETLLQRARELRQTHGALMTEIEEKDILVHAIVHDLAAPLHSIIGVLSLLREQALPEPAAEWLALAMQAAFRQRELISEILDVFVASGEGLGPLIPEPTELGAILENVISERRPVAQRRDIRLETIPSALHCSVVAEGTRLFRVLTNLIDNALRYSPPGGVVRVTSRSDGETVLVLVEDQGPGVPAEMLPRLFEKFARGREPGAGTGLGLFYCRITVENWGGGVGYEPRDEGGARFWIRLRVVPPDGDACHAVEREDSDGEALAGRR